MAAITLTAAAIACLPLPSLFSIALFAFQIMVQLSVPLYLGIFSKLGDRAAALGSLGTGIAAVCVLQALWPLGIPWALGLTAGAVALVLNLAVYLALAAAVPREASEQARLDELFAGIAPPRDADLTYRACAARHCRTASSAFLMCASASASE